MYIYFVRYGNINCDAAVTRKQAYVLAEGLIYDKLRCYKLGHHINTVVALGQLVRKCPKEKILAIRILRCFDDIILKDAKHAIEDAANFEFITAHLPDAH